MDRRVYKTKKAIRNAFAELMTKKDINDISVKDISDLADINRKTFYNYYGNVNQILEEIENEIVMTFETEMGNASLTSSMEDPFSVFSKLTEILERDKHFFEDLFKSQNYESLSAKLVQVLKAKAIEHYSNEFSIKEEDVYTVSDYIFAGMLETYRKWFLSDQKVPLETLSRTVSILCFNGIKGLEEQ